MSEKVVTGGEGAYQISDKGCEVLLNSLRPSLSRRARRLMDAQAEGLPKLEWENAGPGLRFRVETPISEEDDILFDFD